jgi:hypothetical protein
VNHEVKLVLELFDVYQKTPALPQVAFDLNKKGVRTKHGKKWNATTVRGILTNEIYIGRYSVAGVSHYVEDYRIMPDALFFQVQKTLMRYKTSKSQRPPMPENRRNAEIDNVFNQFLTRLNPVEERLSENSCYKIRTLTNEELLFRLLNDDWDLIETDGKKFTVRKTVKEDRQGKSSLRLYSLHREMSA